MRLQQEFTNRETGCNGGIRKNLNVMSLMRQHRPSGDVCATSAIAPTAAQMRTFRRFAFVHNRT
jgi:hypothetical protein